MSIKELCAHCGGTGDSNCATCRATDNVCPLCKGEGWVDLPDWARTQSEAVQSAVQTAQLQRHERDQEMQQLQQVGTIQKIIERDYA